MTNVSPGCCRREADEKLWTERAASPSLLLRCISQLNRQTMWIFEVNSAIWADDAWCKSLSFELGFALVNLWALLQRARQRGVFLPFYLSSSGFAALLSGFAMEFGLLLYSGLALIIRSSLMNCFLLITLLRLKQGVHSLIPRSQRLGASKRMKSS